MRIFAGLLVALFFVGSASADPLPKGFRLWAWNGSVKPTTNAGVTTFKIVDRQCSKKDYDDGRGETDCKNGNVKSLIQHKNEKLGQSIEYRFDVMIDPGMSFPGAFDPYSVGFMPEGWDSQLRIAIWDGYEKIHDYLYDLKLDAKHGITFLGKECQAPKDFGKWMAFSMKVHWANDSTGWIKVTCNDQVIYLNEAVATNQPPFCYRTGECDPGKRQDPKLIYLRLGLALNGYGHDWKGAGFPSQFRDVQSGGITIKMRNVSVTDRAVLYSDDDRSNVKQLQTRLHELGCYAGPANGIVDKATKDAALSCRAFGESKLPPDLNQATVATFLETYNGAAVSSLPPGTLPVRPPFTIRIGETNPDRYGHDPEAASQFEGQVDYPDGTRQALNFMLIGDYNFKHQNFNSLGIKLDNSLGKTVPLKLQSCVWLRFEDHDDGKRAVIQLSRRGEKKFIASSATCVIDALPPKFAEEAKFLLSHFREVAESMANIDAIKLISHDGLKDFMERVAKGEISVTAP